MELRRTGTMSSVYGTTRMYIRIYQLAGGCQASDVIKQTLQVKEIERRTERTANRGIVGEENPEENPEEHHLLPVQ